MFFHMVYKSGQIFLPFCHNPRVWQTDGRTDGQTEFSSLDRVCIPCSAVKILWRATATLALYASQLLNLQCIWWSVVMGTIGATTVGTGGDWSPQYWSPNSLAVVFKKQEISQQVVTRMQDLASEFSRIFRYPGPSQRDGATPCRTQYPARPLAGRGAQAPQCWDSNLGPPQLFSRGCAPKT